MRVVRLFIWADILCSFRVQNDLKDGRRRQTVGQAGSQVSLARRSGKPMEDGKCSVRQDTTTAAYTGKRDAICRYITMRYTLSIVEEKQRLYCVDTKCRRLT